MNSTPPYGMVSNIQHFSTGDGEGIRTTVFLKGCNLRCRWCHNPETISGKGQLLYYAHLCSSCGRCAAVCPTGAHGMDEGRHSFKRELCSACGDCVKHCAFSALSLCGERMSADTVIDSIAQDELFYSLSGGGVTISGGEPLLQADFCATLASRCQERGISVSVDTAGCVPYESFIKVIPFTNTFLFDIKGVTAESYRDYTGGDFALALSNLKRLIAQGCGVVARIPVIPGYSDGEDYFAALAGMLSECGVKRADILPFHRMGASKYAGLGLEWEYGDKPSPSKDKMKRLQDILINSGIDCRIDG
ncbi:MAG: glycyl-radical enzyme activating protein [Eubacteriales bacterium]